MFVNSNNDRLNSKYAKLLKSILSFEITNQYDKLSLFYPLRGSKYHGEIMVIGRAVNGWKSFEISQMADDNKLIEILNEVKNIELSWVTESFGKGDTYRTSKSPFWRVIKNILKSLQINSNESDWSQSIVWSNLYKISPSEKGNPSSSLIKFQQEICIDILKDEINLFKPKLIIFITGLDWCEIFLNFFNCKNIKKEINNTVEALYTLNIDEANELTKIIVTCRPEKKKEDVFVKNICDSFEIL